MHRTIHLPNYRNINAGTIKALEENLNNGSKTSVYICGFLNRGYLQLSSNVVNCVWGIYGALI